MMEHLCVVFFQHRWSLQRAFEYFDANGDGVLSTAEFRELLQSMGTDREKLHPNYVEHLLARTDDNHDGIISLDEFLRVYDQLCDLDRVLCAPRALRAACVARAARPAAPG